MGVQLLGEFRDGSGDAQAVAVDGLDVCFDGVHDGDVVSGAGEVCGQRSADGAGAPDEDVVGHGNCNNLPRRRCDAEVKGEKAEGVERSSS